MRPSISISRRSPTSFRTFRKKSLCSTINCSRWSRSSVIWIWLRTNRNSSNWMNQVTFDNFKWGKKTTKRPRGSKCRWLNFRPKHKAVSKFPLRRAFRASGRSSIYTMMNLSLCNLLKLWSSRRTLLLTSQLSNLKLRLNVLRSRRKLSCSQMTKTSGTKWKLFKKLTSGTRHTKGHQL